MSAITTRNRVGMVISVVAAFFGFGMLMSLLVFGTAEAATATAAPATKPAGAANEFPLRAQYIDVAVIETADLAKRFGDVVVVDVRSSYEYKTLHVKGSVLLPLDDSKFIDKVRSMHEQLKRPIVFYCNGKTCRKSYDAAIKAAQARIPNILCYDAGIADWAKSQPDKTVLLGKSPIRPDDLISHEDFKARLLAPKDFEAKVGPKAIVLDVRDRIQRDNPLFPFREERAEMEDKAALDPIIEQAKREKKTVLIYDQVGKQVEWFQYYLESKGLKDYHFLKGGAQAFFDAKYGKVTLGDKKK